MSLLKKYKWTWILLAICIILAGYLLWTTYAKSKLPIIRPVESFSMENVDGRNITLEDTNGKVRLFYFFFSSCPDVCPVTTFRLSQVQDLLQDKGMFGKDAEIISISFIRSATRAKPSRRLEINSKPIIQAGISYGVISRRRWIWR
ncbi:SCO family protein [Paenibacillus sp. D2_2]|uniref:SCO family protein n=1 Tax=Paenibacillus sp. D2_2 TaxID=3073092 RepID=UPI0028160E6D|nr:SCO family protein [Paenibacillus sp. D2_2]WMT40264.1 SCO family protein [Paenibacillus sp. D2_2]